MDYKKAGVDIEAGYESVKLMKKYVQETMRPEVLGGLGGFSGAFDLGSIKDMEEPVLLSGTDGCGTKVKLAFLMDKHDTIGIDAVAMCVNDVACAGGEPLFFLDYIACGKNYPEKIATIVSGVAEGCKQSGCALVGGETAEHPGLMPEDEYDLAGFAVGVVDKKDIITGEHVKDGDVLGFDVLDVVFMDQVSVVSDKLLKNIRAIRENQPKDLDFSLTEKNLIGLAMGFPDYYASELLPEDNILDSVAYQDELKKMNPQEDKKAIDMTGADSQGNKSRVLLVFWILLALGIMWVLYIVFS